MHDQYVVNAIDVHADLKIRLATTLFIQVTIEHTGSQWCIIRALYDSGASDIYTKAGGDYNVLTFSFSISLSEQYGGRQADGQTASYKGREKERKKERERERERESVCERERDMQR